jgi:hypothetical protein
VTRLALAVLLVMLGAPLAGCAGGGGKHAGTRGAPKGQGHASLSRVGGVRSSLVVAVGRGTVPITRHLNAQWLSPTRLAIVTMGSTGCPSLPKRLVVVSTDAITIRLHRPNRFCLDNLVSKRIVIAVDPKRIDVQRRLTIRLFYPESVVRRFTRPITTTAQPLALHAER